MTWSLQSAQSGQIWTDLTLTAAGHGVCTANEHEITARYPSPDISTEYKFLLCLSSLLPTAVVWRDFVFKCENPLQDSTQ